MKEAYVTFETAKLLKEKGFDGLCCGIWHIYKEVFELHYEPLDYSNLRDEMLLAPTQQMACSWLREKGIHIMPTIGCDVNRTPRIFYGAVIALFNDYGDIDYRDPLDENGYDKSEDAVEAALQYVLTNLI